MGLQRTACGAITLVSFALAGLLSGASCGSFGGEPPTAASDAANEQVVPVDAPSDARADAVANDAALSLPCPPPAGGQNSASSWAMRILSIPSRTRREYPFAIVPDATYVTWITQVGSASGGSDVSPYNGTGEARIVRAPKSGAGPTTVIARDQHQTRALALDGDYAYWPSYAQNVTTLMRQRRDADCVVGCSSPTAVLQFSSGVPIVRLVRPAPGVLIAVGGAGELFRITLDPLPLSIQVGVSGTYPALAAVTGEVFAAAGLSKTVSRVPAEGGVAATYLTVPAADAAGVGVAPIATDCSFLWMGRQVASKIRLARHDLASPLSFKDFAALPNDVFDMAADSANVYVATANGDGGITYVDKASQQLTQVYFGSAFALAVDDDGVYFGEHDTQSDHTGTLMMLVKK